ncbi:hypothetical protein KVV02_002464, partial [Mortierella alpina]
MIPAVTPPTAGLPGATALRDEDVTMSEWSYDGENSSDTESEMDREDEKEAMMIARAAELYVGNKPITNAEEKHAAVSKQGTNQDLLDGMYNRRDRLIQRMVTVMRLNENAGKEAQEINLKTYDEAERMLEELEANIKRCEKAFKLFDDLAERRLALAASPKEVAAPTVDVAAPCTEVTVNTVNDPRQFLDQLKHMVLPFVCKELFHANCDRYLSYLVINEYHQRCLEFEFNKRREEGKTLTWEECEVVFLKIALSEQERVEQIKKLLETGREEHETYRQFAMRIARDMRLYGIKDDNEMVLSLLSATV